MRLSILDQCPISSGSNAKEALNESIRLAERADELGYTRYWIAEHHDLPGLACPAPDLMLSAIGRSTDSIRLGSGAVLLPHYKPYNIAERYNMLAALFPGRIDLGIGRAPGGSAEVTMALSDNFLEEVRKMPGKLDELLSFFGEGFPEDHMFSKITPRPLPDQQPIPWLLGTSEKSAILAAEKGMPYAFGHFMTDQDGPGIMRKYKESSSSETITAVSVICAETMIEAEKLAWSNVIWKLKQDQGESESGVPSLQEVENYPLSEEEKQKANNMLNSIIVGDPPTVKEKLIELGQQYDAEEFMMLTITHSYEARLRSYELLAEEFGLVTSSNL
ncbi:LLM class flavin-dependent oxidoreductase [Virgibacillus xinjiangensis]|uniref:LLM class flavin-dependent oxidoreductase n=1 Tax=Virgibacillus xinjiangensis TaxID=393090 RepID=A0ABV7CYG8_9BACI